MQNTSRSGHVIIAGAGLAGSLLSIYLARQGYRVDVFEKRQDMRRSEMSAGRSINLALSLRGIHALREVGLIDDIMSIAIPMRGRMIHAPDSSLAFQPYGKDETEVIYSTSRGELNSRLMTLAEEYENVTMHFGKRCSGLDASSGSIDIVDEESGERERVSGDIVIAADGAGSAIRTAMEEQGITRSVTDFLAHGYKELSIPPAPGGGWLLEKNALHIWPRHSYMLIALPNIDGSFTCTLFYPLEGEHGFSGLDSPEKVRSFFTEQFPDALALMPQLEEEFFTNPVGLLGTVRAHPWHTAGRVALLGDAAHAIVPFFGQGMNCAFEDCTVLNACINEFDGVWEKIIPVYDDRRKPNAEAIADLAIENFVEMRDRVADDRFLAKKQLERILETRFPDRFIPRYTMVTFRRLPYSVAQQRGFTQDAILEELLGADNDASKVDMTSAEALVTSRLITIDSIAI